MKTRGVVLIFTLLTLVGMSGMAFAFLSMLSYEIRGVGAALSSMRVFYVAEAGRARARWALTVDGRDVGWSESNIPFGSGTYTVTTAYSDSPTNQHMTIISDGYIPDSSSPLARRTVIEKDMSIASSAGANLSLGATASASSTQGGNTPSNAIDGSTNTKWISSDRVSSWLKIDYGSAKTVNKVIVTGSKIDSCVVRYSNNDSNWTAVSNPMGSIPGSQSFDNVTARYLRLDINGNKPQVNEFESYDVEYVLGRGNFVTSR